MKKKLVDLIYLDGKQMESDLKSSHRARIHVWLEWMDKKLERGPLEDLLVDEQSEYLVLSNFLNNFLNARLDWIFDSVSDADLRNKYLLALKPFSQQSGIRDFLRHFFQFQDDPNNTDLKFAFLNHSEREVRILWDVYKLIKTKESIDVLLKSTLDEKSFPSVFSQEYIFNMLTGLSEALLLLVKICVKLKYHGQFFLDFPMDCLEPKPILRRHMLKDYLINDIVLDKFDYRNYFFHIFFRSGMKAMYQGEKLVFEYNYLDFEIIRQEFLTHWLKQRLAGNSKKKEVFDRYVIGGQTLSEIIKKDPGAELRVLKQLPKEIFDDLIADVNEAVDDQDKTPIDPMSEKFGQFAKQLLKFKTAKELAKRSVEIIRSYVSKLGKTSPNTNPKIDQKKSVKVKEVVKSEFQIEILKKSDIDFPYFCEDEKKYSKQLALFKANAGKTDFVNFDQRIQDHLYDLEESKVLKRRVPFHEWTIPYRINEVTGEETNIQLLILGAEVKTKPLGMGYGISVKKQFKLDTYFIFGSKKRVMTMGSRFEKRQVDGESYYIYDFFNPLVIEQALKLIQIVLDNQPKCTE